MKYEQYIIGPFDALQEAHLYRRAVEEAGQNGFELVGITSAAGQLYAGVRKPVEPAPKPNNLVMEKT